MRHFIQTRTMSMFSKSLKDFAMEKPPYTIIDPVLTTSYERHKISSKTHNILKSNVPSYVYGPDEEPSPFDVLIYQRHEIEAIRVSSAIAARCVRIAADFLQPGTTTSSLNDLLHQEIVSRNAYPSVLGFKQFPKAISTSVNNVACHGVPDNRPLEHGDIVSVDVTVYKDGFHGVCGRTFVIGKVTNNPIVRYLKSAAEECMFRGIAACLPGSRLIDIGAEIGKFSKKRNIKVIPTLNGHGIGKYFHCYPDVYHVLNNYPGKLKPGMSFIPSYFTIAIPFNK